MSLLDEALRQPRITAGFGLDPQSDVQNAASALLAALPGKPDATLVRTFQAAFNAAGGSPSLAVDGIWGPKTLAALAGYGTVPQPAPFGSKGPADSGQFLPSVLAAFNPFTVPLEGRTNYMYQDSRELVTTGTGNLIDPIGMAMNLPWQVGGRPATADEITSSWNAVKNNTDPSLMSTGARGIAANAVRLSDDALDHLRDAKLAEMIATVVSNFPNVLTWPADAQLGLLGVIWATGPNLQNCSYMSDFVSCMRNNDFAGMAQTAHWGNIAGDRKVALNLLFNNAADVAQKGLDYTFLNWPAQVTVGEALKGGAEVAAVGVGAYVLGGVLFLVGYGLYHTFRR